MDIGIFMPTANNGYIISNNVRFPPTYDLNREMTINAEEAGFDFVLSMVKLRGYGGATEHWDYCLESLVLMSALAECTSKIRLIGSVGILSLHPAMVARMVATIDEVSRGRFGLNIVSGWNKLEYSQYGLWPGDEYYESRYDYAQEYVEILQGLWENGRLSYDGKYFKLEDALCQPTPRHPIEIVCAGQSERGMQFLAGVGNNNFVNAPDVASVKEISDRVKAVGASVDREIGTYALFTIISGETEKEAKRYEEWIREGTDATALEGFMKAIKSDPVGVSPSKLQAHAFMGFPTFTGSYEQVAEFLYELDTKAGVNGVLVTWPDYLKGVQEFGERVIPSYRGSMTLMDQSSSAV